MNKKIKSKPLDYSILVLTILLVAFGIIMVYSASYYMAGKGGDSMSYFKKQIVGAAVGFVAMFFMSRFPYKKLERLVPLGLIVSLVLLLLIYTPLGIESYGARRWINLGMSVQPSEVAKLAIVLFVAKYLTEKKDVMGSFKKGILPVTIVVGVYAGMVLIQPNMSMAMTFVLLLLFMLYLGGAKIKHLAIMALVGGAGAFGLMLAEPYRRARYLAFLDPWADPLDTGWQIIQSLYALGNGGLFGVGLGASRQKYAFLTFAESDFIFSIIGEELGFIGCVALIAVFGLLIWRGMKVAFACPDRFGSLVAAGITLNIAIQVIINILVVTGSMPPTGLPLPFISAGGSSLAMSMAAIGVLMNISKSTKPI